LVDQPHVQAVPGTGTLRPIQPAVRCSKPLRLRRSVQVHRAFAIPVVTKRLDRQLAQGRLLLGKHHRDLALDRPVDAGVGPALFPSIEVGLCFVDRFEAQPLERSPLRVTHSRFDLALTIRIPDPTWQSDRAVVRQDVA
jgi:hypothetical protein